MGSPSAILAMMRQQGQGGMPGGMPGQGPPQGQGQSGIDPALLAMLLQQQGGNQLPGIGGATGAAGFRPPSLNPGAPPSGLPGGPGSLGGPGYGNWLQSVLGASGQQPQAGPPGNSAAMRQRSSTGWPGEQPNQSPYQRRGMSLMDQAMELAAGRQGERIPRNRVNPWIRGRNPLMPGT